MSEKLDTAQSVNKVRSVVAFMGGTFDPIHFGHLRMALELKQALAADQFRLIPCGDPYHKTRSSIPVSVSSARIRQEMLEQALLTNSELMLDLRELDRQGPTYSYDTLVSLREELGAETSLVMVMGMDSFLSLPQWYNWQQLTDLGHILVIHRPGSEQVLCSELRQWYASRKTSELDDLHSKAAGYISDIKMTMLEISSSQIRGLLSKEQSPQYLLPDSVLDFIRQNNLYRTT